MGAELSTYDEASSEQTSTISRNSNRSTSRRQIQQKHDAVLQLVRSLEVRADFYEPKENDTQNAAAGARQGGDDDNTDKEVSNNERPSCYTVLISQCTHLHAEMKALLSLKHNGFSPYELSQIILKLLTLLSATVTIDYIAQSNPTELNGAAKVKTKTEDGSRISQDDNYDLDISNHKNIDWDIKPVGLVKTKTEDGSRPSDVSLKSSASQTSLDSLDISHHANIDWGDMMDDAADDQDQGKTNNNSKIERKDAKSFTVVKSIIKAADNSPKRKAGKSKRSTIGCGIDSSNRSDDSLGIDTSNRSTGLNQRIEQISSAFQDYLKKKSQEHEGTNEFSMHNTATQQKKRTVSLQFDSMGYILGGTFTNEEITNGMMTVLSDGKQVIDITCCGSEGRLQHDSTGHTLSSHRLDTVNTTFALPSQAREALLAVVVLLLSKKKELESISNSLRARKQRIKRQKEQESESWWLSSIFGSNSGYKNNEYMLILNWQPLLRLLIRTAPFLQMNNTDSIKMQFLSNQSPLEKRTVHMITGLRKFFDQGMRPEGWTGDTPTVDKTAREIWHYVKRDLKPDTHPNSYFRALVTLYLFHPQNCSRQFYLKHMPKWMDRWVGVNQTPEIDFLWVVMFCRARKHVKEGDYDWGMIKRHLEHVGPMLEDNRWNDKPARRMSGASSVMSIPMVLCNELSRDEPPIESFQEVDDNENEREKEELRADFMREYNDGPPAKELDNLPKSLAIARDKHFEECRRLSQESV